MYIHEAAAAAVIHSLFIKRANGPEWEGIKIKPTDSIHCCELHISLKGREKIGPRWNPTAADLIADDWVVVS